MAIMDRRAVLQAAAALFASLSLPAAAAELAGSATARLLVVLGNIVIPETNTPGAGSALNAAFVSKALSAGILRAQPVMLTRLAEALDQRAGGSFLAASPSRQAAIVATLDSQAYAPAAAAPAADWRTIKALLLIGYYTSEDGGSKELRYEPVPGRYEANIAIVKGQAAISNDWTSLTVWEAFI